MAVFVFLFMLSSKASGVPETIGESAFFFSNSVKIVEARFNTDEGKPANFAT